MIFTVLEIVDFTGKHGRIKHSFQTCSENGCTCEYYFNEVNEDFSKLQENSSRENDFLQSYLALWVWETFANPELNPGRRRSFLHGDTPQLQFLAL